MWVSPVSADTFGEMINMEKEQTAVETRKSYLPHEGV